MALGVLLHSLLVLSSLYGAQGRGALRTLPNDGGVISCTGDLVCEELDMLCMIGDIYQAVTPVLVPTDLRAETVKRCHGDYCSLCVQVTVEISADFLTEHSEELGSGDCDFSDEDYNDSYEDDEMEETTAVNLYLQVNNSNNGSLLCAHLIIDPPSFSCYAMRVSLPLSAVPPAHNSSSMVVGSVVYNCISVQPGADMNLLSYSSPRYSKTLSITHEVPDCTQLDPQDKIWKCDYPVLDFVSDSNETSVGIVNAPEGRSITVWVFYCCKSNKTHSNSTIIGEMRHYIPPSDISPCMCIQAWYSDLLDAYRTMLCPFKNYSRDNMLRSSRLVLTYDKTAVYELRTSCAMKAEATLCWKSDNSAECRAIPNTSKTISSQVPYDIRGLEVAHPSLCVQVSLEGRILHTECFKANVSRELQNGVVVVKKDQSREFSLCRVEDGGCKTLYNGTHQSRIDIDFLDEKLVEDVISEQCVKVLSVNKQQVYVCNVNKYMRSRWIWSRVLCLLVVACVLLIVLLKIDDLKKWLKSVTAERPLDAIFKNRRVLILYCPDSPAYEELVRVFALSLQDLKLDVVLDQWHRTEMVRVNPLPWYQKQKSEAFETRGLIILLLSEGAKKKYVAWKEQKPEQVVDSDPYGSFGAVLNCVYADFQKGQTKGRYLVASFSSNSDVVPDLFRLRQVYTLPSQLVKLLQELAGDEAKSLGRKQAKRLSNKISDSLQAPLNTCLKNLNRQTGISQDGSEASESPGFSGKVAVELEPLV